MAERWAFAFREGTRLDDREPIFGEQRAVVELARYVQQVRKADVSLLVNSDADVQFGIPVGCGAQLAEQVSWIRQQKPDVVVGISSGLIFCRVHGRKNIVYHHNPTIVEGVGQFGRELYARIQKILVVSADARNRQIEWGAPASKVAVVPNGVDHAIYYPRCESHSPDLLVFAGSIIDYKGVDVVLAAFSEAKQRLHTAQLHFFGKNLKYAATAAARQGAEWMSERGLLAADGTVDWEVVEKQFPGVRYQGCVEGDRLAEAFSQASLLLVGSRIPETFGLTSIEAQACGCIPIVPDHGGLRETILPGRTGVTYPAGDSISLAERILQLCRPEFADELKSWRRQSVECIRQNYSWEKTGEAFCQEVEQTNPHYLGNDIAARMWRLRRMTRQRLRSLFSQ